MLTIVMPAYNAQNTISDSLDSILKCDCDFITEIVVCNDASTDGTNGILEEYQKNNDIIKVITNSSNLGGGFSRNTAIKAAKNELIYVLDSDDIIDKESICTLFKNFNKGGIDGVHYDYAYYFTKSIKRPHNYESYYEVFGNEITLKKVLDKKVFCINFLFSKNSWEKSGGYPEDYGWDTQGFTLKFLEKNKSIRVLKGTKYYHRKFSNQVSYYQREESKGLTWINSWLIFEDIIESVSDNFILDCIVSNSNKLAYSSEEGLFDCQNVLNADHEEVQKLVCDFKRAICLYRSKDFLSAHIYFLSALEKYPESKLLTYCFYRSVKSIKNSNYCRVQSYVDLRILFSPKSDVISNKGIYSSTVLSFKFFARSVLLYFSRKIGTNTTHENHS